MSDRLRKPAAISALFYLLAIGSCGLICTCVYLGAIKIGIWTPMPAHADIQAAVSEQFKPVRYDLDFADGPVSYKITTVTRPSQSGVGDPKMWIWLRATDGRGKQAEGLLLLSLIQADPKQVYVMCQFTTRSDLEQDPSFLQKHFTPRAIQNIQALIAQAQ
ncbi:MAG TPA: hypothetical protein VGD69_17435 [Herpetosiphonaceae bacterium]